MMGYLPDPIRPIVWMAYDVVVVLLLHPSFLPLLLFFHPFFLIANVFIFISILYSYIGADGTRTPLHLDKLATIAINLYACGEGM